MLPSIQRCAAFPFRRLPRARRRELEQDVVANTNVAFARLAKRGLESIAYPTALAKFAVRQVLDGRQVGCRQNISDLSSPYCQAKKGIVLERLNQRLADGQWQERLVTDRRATPAELIAWKLDFGAWLERLDAGKRHVALRLAAGDTPSEAARHFHVSRARISQIRRQLRTDWDAFSQVIGVN
jgi:hypothetical protein